MKSNKKAQGAMEYLMTYGWAIIVVMIVGLALWNAGILKIGPTYPKGFSGFSGVRPLDWTIYSQKEEDITRPAMKLYRFSIVNVVGNPITITDLYYEGSCGGVGGGLGHRSVTEAQAKNIPNNEVRAIQIPCWYDSDPQYDVCDIVCYTFGKGEPYKIKFTITYNQTIDKDISIVHNSIGYIWGTYD